MARFTQGGGSGDGSALNYVQVESNQVTITTAPQDVVSLEITTTGKPVQVSITGEGANASAGSWVKMALFRDGTLIGQTIQIESSAASENVPYALNFIDEVSAGTHTYTAKIVGKSAGNWTFGEVSGPVMNAVELTGFKGDTGATGPQGVQGEQGEPGITTDTFDIIYTTHNSDGTNIKIGDDAWIGDIDLSNNIAIIGIEDDTQGGIVFGAEGIGKVYTDNLDLKLDANNDIILNPGSTYAYIGTPQLDGSNRIAKMSDITGGADLIVPTAIKDQNNNDFITFTKTGTGTARIGTPQDDLSLRSARDITLFAGDDGPGNVYIGWGDAVYTPDSPNRVATIGDLQAANTGDFIFNTNEMSMVNNNETMILKTIDSVGIQKGEIRLDPNNGIAKIKTNNEENEYYESSWPSWSLATWTSNGSDSYLTLADAPDIFQLLNSNKLNYASNITISVNGGNRATYNGWSGGPSEFTLFLGGVNNDNYDVVNNVQFFYNVTSQLLFDYNEGEAILESQDLNLQIRTTGSRDISLFAGDDIDITAGDDIRLYSNNNNGSHQWRMNSEGGFEFPGSGWIKNPIASSGDGLDRDTFVIVPDGTIEGDGSHQYLIIDPTAPNHIHVRAGGTQDASSADLFLGAEMTHVRVSDQTRDVYISSRGWQQSMAHANINQEANEYLVTTDVVTANSGWTVEVNGTSYIISDVQLNTPIEGQTTIYAPGAIFGTYAIYNVFAPDYTNQWTFDSDGTLYGPAGGSLTVSGITGKQGDNIFNVVANQNLVLQNGEGYGAYLNDSNSGLNQIATIGDITTAVGVGGNGEVTRWSPNFTATGLAFTGTDATYPTYNSHYVKNGRMVSFWIAIDLDTVTNFGTGQYKTALPFAPLTGTMNHFQAWANVDPTLNPDIAGHVVLQADHLANTSVLDLHYLKQAGGANSPLMEALFVQGTPATLTTSSKIYINGTYITAE